MIYERRYHISAYLLHFIAEPNVALFKSKQFYQIRMVSEDYNVHWSMHATLQIQFRALE
jgi:hypothetical protein